MDVKELLESKNLTFISSGRDYRVRCLSPDHDDSNPSMNIDKITGLYNCLSCGYSGDIYQHFNINKEKFINIKIQKVREKINSMINNTIPMPLDASYVEEDYRGISKSTLRKFSAFTTESIKGMEGRIVFPITNINRDIIGFQGRYMYSDLSPKYKFYPSEVVLPLFPSIVKPIKNTIVLVEGIFDMINLHDKGMHNAVCTFGAGFGSHKKSDKKHPNLDKLLQFKYQGIEHIWILYDGDDAGRKGAKNIISWASDSFSIDSIDLEEGADPGSMDKSDVNKLIGELYD